MSYIAAEMSWKAVLKEIDYQYTQASHLRRLVRDGVGKVVVGQAAFLLFFVLAVYGFGNNDEFDWLNIGFHLVTMILAIMALTQQRAKRPIFALSVMGFFVMIYDAVALALRVKEINNINDGRNLKVRTKTTLAVMQAFLLAVSFIYFIIAIVVFSRLTDKVLPAFILYSEDRMIKNGIWHMLTNAKNPVDETDDIFPPRAVTMQDAVGKLPERQEAFDDQDDPYAEQSDVNPQAFPMEPAAAPMQSQRQPRASPPRAKMTPAATTSRRHTPAPATSTTPHKHAPSIDWDAFFGT
jgi:hypothetical protein